MSHDLLKSLRAAPVAGFSQQLNTVAASPAPLSCTPNQLEPSMYMKLSFQWFTFSVGGNRLGASCLRLCRKVGKYRETFFPSGYFFFFDSNKSTEYSPFL